MSGDIDCVMFGGEKLFHIKNAPYSFGYILVFVVIVMFDV